MTLSYLDSHSSLKALRVKPLPAAFFKNAADMTFPDIAYVVIDVLLGDEIAHSAIKQLIDAAYPAGRPIADGAFQAALIRSLRPVEVPTVFALSRADAALARALAATGPVIVFCSRSRLLKLPAGAAVIEIQGSEAECQTLANEVAREIQVFTTDCAVATAVNAAKAIYLATRPEASLAGLPEAMGRGFEIAFAMGLPRVEFTTSSDVTATTFPQPGHERINRIPPKLDSALRLINASTKALKKLK